MARAGPPSGGPDCSIRKNHTIPDSCPTSTDLHSSLSRRAGGGGALGARAAPCRRRGGSAEASARPAARPGLHPFGMEAWPYLIGAAKPVAGRGLRPVQVGADPRHRRAGAGPPDLRCLAVPSIQLRERKHFIPSELRVTIYNPPWASQHTEVPAPMHAAALCHAGKSRAQRTALIRP